MAKLKDRYAIALLELTNDDENLESYVGQSIMVRDALNNHETQAFLKHPYIPDSVKFDLFESAFQGKLDKHLMGFLQLLVKKNREELIISALTEYIERANRLLGRIEARFVSSKEVTVEEVESIRNILNKQLNMEVNVQTEVDPDVIGGFYLLVDGHIFDGTVRSKLNKMREELKRGGYQ